jgi:hypothetical protein
MPLDLDGCVFISYSHRDLKWLRELLVALSPLLRKGEIKVWCDTLIKPGDEWRKEIGQALSVARAAVLLVRHHYLASDFIAHIELRPLLRSAEQRGARILWVAVSHSLYKETHIARYQAVNNPEKPLDCLRRPQLGKALATFRRRIRFWGFDPVRQGVIRSGLRRSGLSRGWAGFYREVRVGARGGRSQGWSESQPFTAARRTWPRLIRLSAMTPSPTKRRIPSVPG